MHKEMRAEIVRNNGIGNITAVHAADQLNKLRQILCGAIKDPVTNEYIPLDFGPRFLDLCDIIDQAAAKVIIVVPFKGIIRHLEAALLAAGYTVGVLNGDVTVGKRKKIIDDFKNTPNPQNLLCHPQVMAHGLNLTEADYTVFYAPIYSYDQYAQVIERFNRTGQTRKMTVVRMAAHPMEWAIYRVIDNRHVTQQTILDLYAEVTERTNGGLDAGTFGQNVH